MNKPKVAFFDFASCEGCQIEFTNFGDAAFLERDRLGVLLEHRVLLELLMHHVDELEAGQLQQLDRLLELWRHHQLLRQLQLLPEFHSDHYATFT